MRKPRAVIFVDELECQDSPVLAVMKYYGSPLTREEFLSLHFMGEIPEIIDSDEEETFPEQFRRKTLLDTPAVSTEVQ